MASYFLWSCNNCGLFNYDETNHCQACFKKTTKTSPINSLQRQQRILFDGFLRTEVIIHSQHEYDNIPTYLFDFSFTFFGINIKLLCQTGDKTHIYTMRTPDLYEVGEVLHKNDEYFFSYQIMSILLKHHPKIANFHNAMALILAHWGNLESSAMEYEKAMQLAPSSHTIKRNYGILLRRQRKLDLALKQFVNANKLDLNNAKYALEMAVCYEEMNDHKSAEQWYLHAITLNPSEHICYYYYAVYLRTRDEYEKSRKYYQKCLEINPKHKYIHSSYAYLLYLMKRFDEAQKCIELELDIDDTNHWVYYYQGLLYKEFGNETLAQQSLLTAIKFCQRKDHMMPYLETMKRQDSKNTEYHDKCCELLNNKFKSV